MGGALASERSRIAAGRALRTAVVTFAGFAIGQWVAGSQTVAVFATFTGLAITGIADFGGSMKGRAGAVTVAVVAGIGLTALGTWTSTQDIAVICGAMFIVAALIAMTELLGGYAAAGANALILFFVIAAGSPAPLSEVTARIGGVLLGGGLAVVGALLLWPAASRPQAVRRLGAELGVLAARLRHLAAGDPASPPGSSPEPRPSIRQVIDGLTDRPAAPTATQRAVLYLLNDTERMGDLIGVLERSPTTLNAAEIAVVSRSAAAIARASAALAGESSELGIQPLETVMAKDVPVLSRTERLAAAASAACAHANAALALTARTTIVDAFTSDHASGSRTSDIRHGLRRLAANWSLSSVHVQDALRLGAGLAVAALAVRVFSLQHGFWVVFATLTVIKSNIRATGRSVDQAIAGTVLGFAAATGIIAAFGNDSTAYLALLPITVAGAIYANVAISFLAGQAGFTIIIVVLFNLLGPAGWRVGVVRVEDVVAGAVVGLAIGALMWPRGAKATMAPAVARLFEDASGYLVHTVRALVDGMGRATGDSAPGTTTGHRTAAPDQRRAAVGAAARAESSFAQYLAENPPPHAIATWADLLSAGNRLWYAADLLGTELPTRSWSDAERSEIRAAADSVAVHYGALARALRTCRGVIAPGGHTPDAHVPQWHVDLSVWLDDLVGRPDVRVEPARSVTADAGAVRTPNSDALTPASGLGRPR